MMKSIENLRQLLNTVGSVILRKEPEDMEVQIQTSTPLGCYQAIFCIRASHFGRYKSLVFLS
jgi:hypothetical protein